MAPSRRDRVGAGRRRCATATSVRTTPCTATGCPSPSSTGTPSAPTTRSSSSEQQRGSTCRSAMTATSAPATSHHGTPPLAHRMALFAREYGIHDPDIVRSGAPRCQAARRRRPLVLRRHTDPGDRRTRACSTGAAMVRRRPRRSRCRPPLMSATTPCVAHPHDAEVPVVADGKIVRRPQARRETSTRSPPLRAPRADLGSQRRQAGSTGVSAIHCPAASRHGTNPAAGKSLAEDRRGPHPLEPGALREHGTRSATVLHAASKTWRSSVA